MEQDLTLRMYELLCAVRLRLPPPVDELFVDLMNLVVAAHNMGRDEEFRTALRRFLRDHGYRE